MTSDDFGTQKLTDEPRGSISFTNINGKIVSDAEFDKAMLRNFKTCAGYDKLEDEVEEETKTKNFDSWKELLIRYSPLAAILLIALIVFIVQRRKKKNSFDFKL